MQNENFPIILFHNTFYLLRVKCALNCFGSPNPLRDLGTQSNTTLGKNFGVI